jgi:phage shock protein A
VARTKQQITNVSVIGLLSELVATQDEINDKLNKIERLRERRDELVLNALDANVTYRLLQQETGLARSTLIKINEKGTSR